MSLDLITATHSDFSPFLDQVFYIETEGGRIELILGGVKTFKRATTRDNHLEVDGIVYPPRTSFALTFLGPPKPILEPKTYEIVHSELGQLMLFISPFMQDLEAVYYETVIS